MNKRKSERATAIAAIEAGITPGIERTTLMGVHIATMNTRETKAALYWALSKLAKLQEALTDATPQG